MPAWAPNLGALSGSKPAIVARFSSPLGGSSKIIRRRSRAFAVLRRIQPWAPISLKRSTLVAGSLQRGQLDARDAGPSRVKS